MISQPSNNGKFRLFVDLQDAMRFELLLDKHGIAFQSYQETLQDFVKVFMFHDSDTTQIDTLIKKYNIATGNVDQTFISSNSVKVSKMYLLAMAIITAITLILLSIGF